MADDMELLRLRAKAKLKLQDEAEAEQPAQETPKPGILSRAAGWVGKQMERVPGAIKGAVQAYQTGDPHQAADMALQGFKDPASVQSSEQMMGRAGADTAMTKPQIKTPPPDAQTQWNSLGNIPDPIKRTMLGWEPGKADTTYTSNAKELGQGFDALAPTGLEFLPGPLRAAMGRSGRGLQHTATDAIQSSLKPSQVLRRAPVPYESEGFLTPRPGFPDGLGSARGKGRTLENIEAYHERLGDAQDAILQNMPQVDVLQAIANASQDVEQSLLQGGNAAMGLSARDAHALRAEIQHWTEAADRISPNGTTTGQNARQLRASLGHEARYNGSAEATNARRVVAATIRERLNEEFAQLSPEFRRLDRQFAETIPLRNSVAEALGKEGNRYPLGLRTSMVVATGGASIPAEMAKIALIEGTSRFAPQVAMAKAGRAVSAAADAARPYQNAVIPAMMAARAAKQKEK